MLQNTLTVTSHWSKIPKTTDQSVLYSKICLDSKQRNCHREFWYASSSKIQSVTRNLRFNTQSWTIITQITSLTIVYSAVYSGTDQRKHQSSASLAFVCGIHRGPVNSPHKWPVTRKMFPFDDVIMEHTFETRRPFRVSHVLFFSPWHRSYFNKCRLVCVLRGGDTDRTVKKTGRVVWLTLDAMNGGQVCQGLVTLMNCHAHKQELSTKCLYKSQEN